MFKRLSRTEPRVNMARGFEDGDFVFTHMEYDFSSRKIGFEVFRFEDGQAVEHWDNIQERLGPNTSGHSMVDGSAEVTDLDRTEDNRSIARSFIETVLIGGDLDALSDFVDNSFIEHNPKSADGIAALQAMLKHQTEGRRSINYRRLHRVLAHGNFALTVSEGERAGIHSAFYDLFRLADGKIVEHWDTTEKVAPHSEWKNDNGKF